MTRSISNAPLSGAADVVCPKEKCANNQPLIRADFRNEVTKNKFIHLRSVRNYDACLPGRRILARNGQPQSFVLIDPRIPVAARELGTSNVVALHHFSSAWEICLD